MHRLVIAALLSAVAALGTVSTASAQTVERSGNTYHVKACGGPDIRGYARCHAHVVTDSRGTPIAHNVSTGYVPGGFGPTALKAAYKVTSAGSSSTIIAIVDAFGYTNAEADLAIYRSTFGLPVCSTANGCFKKVNQSGVQGSYPVQNTGWQQETALDLDMASAICPNCKIVLVEATSNSNANLAAAVNTAASLGAHVISNSYGGGEAGSTSYESAYNHPGVAITASSGDSGYGVQFPASSPHVTAVGGTSLYVAANARGYTETAWADAGSGCSTLYAKPSWQSDPLCAMRMEADVSAVADPSTGVAVYGPAALGHSSWLVFGGTSVAAPLVGAIYAVNGLYAYYGSDPYYYGSAGLYDVTSGSNGSCGGTYFCVAGVGYDGPTGLGTPHGVAAFGGDTP